MFYILDMDFAIEVIQRRHEMDSLNSCLQLGSLEADFVVAYQIGGGGFIQRQNGIHSIGKKGVKRRGKNYSESRVSKLT